MPDSFFSSIRNEFGAGPDAAGGSAFGGTFSTLSTVSINGGLMSLGNNGGDTFAPTPPFNFRILLVFASFLVPYLAFLLILPGVREKRFASFIAITIQIGVGLLLMASLILPYWKVGEVTIVSQFYSHSRLRHEAHLGVNVGLEYINITLRYIGTINTAEVPFRGLYLNERYHMSGVDAMSHELQSAYRRGLPYPLLKVMEYFSLSQGAFAWGRLYRNAGYYTNAVLWLAFACWVLQCVMLALVPHHYSKTGMLCGIMALLSNCVYVGNTPSTDVKIPFESRSGESIYLLLHYGSCIYMSFFAGIIAIAFGIILSLLQFLRLYSISTCLSGYLDDTVGPKCKWSQNNKINDKMLQIEMKSAPKPIGVNGWTTMESSASTAASSSSSSTNGDNTETYITDETASAGDLTPASSAGREKTKTTNDGRNVYANQQRVIPESPGCGITARSKGGTSRNLLAPPPSITLKSNLYNNNKSAMLQNSAGNIKRDDEPIENDEVKRERRIPLALTLSSSERDVATNPENTTQIFFNDSKLGASSPSEPSTPHAINKPKLSLPIYGESSDFRSSRSSISSCSLAAEDDDDGNIAARRSSLAANNFFRFTDDEEESHKETKSARKMKKQEKHVNSPTDSKVPKRSLFRVPQLSF